ncbi:MAG: PAS domain-containing protein [Herminiimonas sp.]|nr:PAS domain-containing protein [Herminiimonas sp.]
MHTLPNYAALFDASPYPYLLVDPDLVIIGANQAYLRATGRAADIIGQPIFQAFPADPADPESTNVAQVAASIEHALRTGLPHTVAFLRYAIPRQTPTGTVFEERFWSTVHTPVRGADGAVAFVAQNAIDVTDLYTFDRAAGVAQVDGTSLQIQPPENPDRVQMHEAMKRILNDERSHLSSLFNQAPGFITVVSGASHVFEMANEAYYQLVGHRDIIGKPVFEALPELEGQGFSELLDKVFSSGEAVVSRSIKAQVQRIADGPLSDRYIDLVLQPLFSSDGKVSGIFAQGHDVTDAHDAQQALREADERLREGMLAARMVIWDMDLASGAVKFSDNVLAVFGANWHTAQAVWESLHPEDVLKLHAARQQAIACRGEYQQCVRLIRPGDQAVIWLQVMGKVRCDADGGVVGVRGVSLDITERMKAEQDLREADRRKDEFLAMLAHELRNPLAPISAAAQLLKMPLLKQEMVKKTSDIIGRQVGHMTSLIDDLLDVSRVTRGLIMLERKRLGIMVAVTDAVEQVRPLINARRQDLSVRLPADAIEILGDQKRLVQVLTNLLNNAAKYTPEGGMLELIVEATATQVSVCIRDNGIGIPADLLPHVFDLFTQAERTPDRSQGGLGLGLALVRNLVALHGGSVAATSDGKGQGAAFTVQLPRIVDAPPRDGWKSAQAAAPRRDKRLRLLVVDDNADAAEMLGAFMESVGHEVIIEHEPHMAIERARAEPPDACLLDIGLPGMDGNQLARRLRAMPEMSAATLIAVTGYGKKFDRDTSIAAGFDYYFVKPADPVALIALLDRIHVS